jgi:hypothetical protein
MRRTDMAVTIAEAWGYDNNRVKETSRLGSRGAKARAATSRTFATAIVNADGSGAVIVTRDHAVLHTYEFGPEEEE